MTENDARERVVGLDNWYRFLLESTDQIEGMDPQIRNARQQKFLACEQDFDDVRWGHPHLFANLQEKYMLACAGKLETKGRWPKADVRVSKQWGVVPTTSDLMEFAYEEDFNLFGEPQQIPHFSPD